MHFVLLILLLHLGQGQLQWDNLLQWSPHNHTQPALWWYELTPLPTPTISCWLSLFVRSLRRNGLNWSAPFLCSSVAMVATLLSTGCCVRGCRSAMLQRPSAKGRDTPAAYTSGPTASCLASRSGGLIHALWSLWPWSWSYTGKPDLSTSCCRFTSHAVRKVAYAKKFCLCESNQCRPPNLQSFQIVSSLS